MASMLFIISISLLSLNGLAFYLPGVAPIEFPRDAEVEVKAVKLTSVKTQLPYEYYALPFCQPQSGVVYKAENLGEVLRGDRIVNTPYLVKMASNVKCQVLCQDKGLKYVPVTLTKDQSKDMADKIMHDYYVHLIVDNLPCATPLVMPDGTTIYEHGYRLGVVSGKEAFLHNHINLILSYHKREENALRVVGFKVKPQSFAASEIKIDASTGSCDISGVKNPMKINDDATTEVLFIYSVEWEESDIGWASRWDIYLAMSDVQIHWFSIINSVVVVFFLSGILTMIMVRTLRRDIAQYNKDDDLDETVEETGWKLVHGDVFRPPRFSKLLTSLIGVLQSVRWSGIGKATSWPVPTSSFLFRVIVLLLTFFAAFGQGEPNTTTDLAPYQPRSQEKKIYEITKCHMKGQLQLCWIKKDPYTMNKHLFCLAIISIVVMTGRLLWRYKLAQWYHSRKAGNRKTPLEFSDNSKMVPGVGAFPVKTQGIGFVYRFVDVTAEVVFLIDGSISIPRQHFDKMLRLCSLLTFKFPIPEKKLKTASVIFSTEPFTKARFDEFLSRNLAVIDILNIQHLRELTRTDKAFQWVLRDKLFSKGTSPKSVKILFLLTHLLPSPIDPCIRIAGVLRSSGIIIIVIGVTDKHVKVADLMKIAGSEDNVFTTEDFNSFPHLDTHILSRVHTICNNSLSME